MRALILLIVALFAENAAAQVFTPTRAPLSEPRSANERQLRQELEAAKVRLSSTRAAEAAASAAATREGKPRTAEAQAAARQIEALASQVAELRKQLSETSDRARLLTQGALDGLLSEQTPTVSIQAADFFFNETFRLYLRSTLSIEDDNENEADEQGEGAGETDTDAGALEERIKSALLDPYGGLLYLTTGALKQIGPVLAEERTPRGLFLDVRGGVKAVQLNEGKAEDSNPIVPFATVSAGVALQWPVWNSIADTDDDGKSVGDLVLGLTWVGNAVLDKDASDLFAGAEPQLDEWTHTIALSAGISLKGVAKLTFTGNPWSSNSSLGKRFAVGLTVVRED